MWWIGAVPKSAESQYEIMFLIFSLSTPSMITARNCKIAFYSMCGQGIGIAKEFSDYLFSVDNSGSITVPLMIV